MPEYNLPQSLEKGDKVAIIATSNGVQEFPEVLRKGVDRLEQRFGLKSEVYPTAEKSTDYLNDNPRQKAEEFMQAFEDPQIRGVIALTGGTEQLRMLKYLEPERLKENPTRFYGISDNTNLHLYLSNLGIQSFYGGQILDDLLAEGEIGEYTYSYLEKAFFQEQLGDLESSKMFTDDYFDLFKEELEDGRERYNAPEWEYWNFNGETVEGRIWGGCLGVIPEFMAADRYMPDQDRLEGNVLVLETSEEHPAIVDVKRRLMVMGERGILQKFSAILVGRPMRAQLMSEEKTVEDKREYHKKQKEAIKQEIKNYCPETPAVFDIDFGHTHPKIPLPIGGKLRINPENQEIESL
ncbi:S66 family peptidase [Candidatus Nanohalovita haloferacivicina]|uniref:S66 family peptidase n=1 Tax=Candidatus Nanohalovita haloferacivicina TaxID=2978046 RepID=UPI00325FBD04|nr:Putative MccF-like protein (microcin C7 resistance) [Candidatus Nanohalobia archaeon BNXNv]